MSHAAPPFTGRPAGVVIVSVLTACAVVGFLMGGVMGASSGSGGDSPTVDAATSEVPWDGAVTAVSVQVVDASCQSEPSRDASGARVTYDPEFAVDDDVESAWRCAGDGVGETLVIDLGEPVRVAEVGLVPGYAKTDPSDDTDRYAENRRLTAVRWRFDDDTTVEQELDADAQRRDLQTMRVPVRSTQQLTMEILSSSDGDRDTIAVSDLRVSAAS
ncbi:MAG TPA: discoidin domain-containing protein [Jiangellaceae bacterium]|nr:discoidin domain-containing protein [Jiangellaceae bacterium]